MSALETRNERDTRIGVVDQARVLVAEQKNPRTALINGETVAFFCEWLIYVSDLLDRATLDEGCGPRPSSDPDHPSGASAVGNEAGTGAAA